VSGTQQECCYDATKLVPYNHGGGHTSRFDRVTRPAQHLLLDQLPYLMCSKFTHNALKFHELRPTDNCFGYTLPARGEAELSQFNEITNR